jgi:activator of HSP90 ATPase
MVRPYPLFNTSIQKACGDPDHYATLTTELDQQEDSTKLVFTLKGVPKGIEDEIERNIEGY